jgi:hypothetical protein
MRYPECQVDPAQFDHLAGCSQSAQLAPFPPYQQSPPPGSPQAYYPSYALAVAPLKFNRLAVASLCCSIAGLFSLLLAPALPLARLVIPLLLPLAILAVVFGFVALSPLPNHRRADCWLLRDRPGPAFAPAPILPAAALSHSGAMATL